MSSDAQSWDEMPSPRDRNGLKDSLRESEISGGRVDRMAVRRSMPSRPFSLASELRFVSRRCFLLTQVIAIDARTMNKTRAAPTAIPTIAAKDKVVEPTDICVSMDLLSAPWSSGGCGDVAIFALNAFQRTQYECTSAPIFLPIQFAALRKELQPRSALASMKSRVVHPLFEVFDGGEVERRLQVYIFRCDCNDRNDTSTEQPDLLNFQNVDVARSTKNLET